jgi:MFS family permease
LSRVVTSGTVTEADLALVLAPRDGLLAEKAAGRYSFVQSEGPLAAYHRVVSVTPAGAGAFSITQEVSFRVGLPYVSWLFVLPLRSHLRALSPPDRYPWWAPPARLPRRAAVVLAVLCALTVLVGYLSDLLPETMTYAAGEFGVGSAGQGIALGIAQVSAVVALGVLLLGDRRGRRPVLIGSSAVAALLTASGAVSPSLSVLTATQVAAGSATTAAFVLIGVLLIEEMPRGARAWAIAVSGMCFGLGTGLGLLALPLAGMGRGGWRWLFGLGLLTLPGIVACGRHLPESRRFEAFHGREPLLRPLRGDRQPALSDLERRRLLVLGAGSLLFAMFFTPAAQLQNHYLQHERHMSALRISVVEQVAGTIGGLGALVGGRLADTVGRRPVAAGGVLVGAAFTLASYSTGGIALWGWITAGSFMSYAVGPALAVYGGELFPTSIRGRAGGILTVLAAAGGLVGLVAAGGLNSVIGSVGPALCVLAVAPLALVALIALAYPETAQTSLEALNPGDARWSAGAQPGGEA